MFAKRKDLELNWADGWTQGSIKIPRGTSGTLSRRVYVCRDRGVCMSGCSCRKEDIHT